MAAANPMSVVFASLFLSIRISDALLLGPMVAASSHVHMAFVMAMQIARFLFILLFGPAIAKTVTRTLHKVI